MGTLAWTVSAFFEDCKKSGGCPKRLTRMRSHRVHAAGRVAVHERHTRLIDLEASLHGRPLARSEQIDMHHHVVDPESLETTQTVFVGKSRERIVEVEVIRR